MYSPRTSRKTFSLRDITAKEKATIPTKDKNTLANSFLFVSISRAPYLCLIHYNKNSLEFVVVLKSY